MERTRRKGHRDGYRNRSTPLPRLRELRQNAGLSQRGLGGLAKVATGTVYRLETGQRGAYPNTIRKLAAALAVPPVELIRGHHRE
jgi:transcriptional regulator with XRE-family HTH domain